MIPRLCVLAFAASAALAGCAPPPPPPIPLSEGATDLAPAGPRALFAEEPRELITAFEEACAAPGQTLLRPAPGTLQCESLPPVEAAAGLILQFGGSVDDLPRLVTLIVSTETDRGVVVSSDTYIRVPQQDGSFRVLRPEDPSLDDTIRTIFRRAGGTPI